MARNLNNETRNDLAVKLATLAMKKHGAGIGRLAASLHKQMTERHIRLLAEVAPELSPKRWEELIQARVVASFGSGEDLHYFTFREDGKKEGRPRLTVTGGEIVNLSKVPGRNVEDPKRHELLCDLYSELRNVPGFPTALDLISAYERTRQIAPKVAVITPPQHALPNVLGARTLDPDVPSDARLLKDMQAFAARMRKLLAEGFAYLEECLLLLQACRTDKQLADLFPEAAKLLPPPPQPRANIVPVELAQRVRKMLETGVPED